MPSSIQQKGFTTPFEYYMCAKNQECAKNQVRCCAATKLGVCAEILGIFIHALLNVKHDQLDLRDEVGGFVGFKLNC